MGSHHQYPSFNSLATSLPRLAPDVPDVNTSHAAKVIHQRMTILPKHPPAGIYIQFKCFFGKRTRLWLFSTAFHPPSMLLHSITGKYSPVLPTKYLYSKPDVQVLSAWFSGQHILMCTPHGMLLSSVLRVAQVWNIIGASWSRPILLPHLEKALV